MVLPKRSDFAGTDPASLGSMKQEELTRELAREARLPAAVAQDRIDELVHRIILKLRRGQRVDLPGVGKLVVNGRAGRLGRR
jgi:nucleoid DNA-binding protein